MSTGRRFVLLAFVLLLFTTIASPSAQGVIVPFTIFTDNGDYSDGNGVDLSVDIFDGEGIAQFKFYNDSIVDCSITKIFYDDGTLLDINSITNGSGTDFSEPVGGPGDLPGGSLLDPDFMAEREFNVGADAPPYWKGVNNIGAGEYVTVTFDLINGGTVQGVLGEIVDGTLRIGLHVQGFDDGSSESAINEPVPEPATILLLGLGGLALLRKRRN